MIHLVCECGALVSVPPGTGGRPVPCRSCGRVVEVPAADALGLDLPPPPLPAPVPAPLPPSPPASAGPVFDSDARLNLRVLEGEAARLLLTGRIVLVAGFAAAAAALLLPGWTGAERGAGVGGALFAAVAAWIAFRAARASCLASVALAQRQREILRSVSRG